MVICGFSVILFREHWVFQMVCCCYISRGALTDSDCVSVFSSINLTLWETRWLLAWVSKENLGHIHGRVPVPEKGKLVSPD